MKNIAIALVAILIITVFGLFLTSIVDGQQKSNTVSEAVTENVAASAAETNSETKAEPEKFEDMASADTQGESETTENSNVEEAAASEDNEQATTSEEDTDKDLRTDMSEHAWVQEMVNTESRIVLLESRLTKSTPNLLRVQKLVQQAKDDLKIARAAYVAHDDDSADRHERMTRLGSFEFESACDLAGIKLKAIEDALTAK